MLNSKQAAVTAVAVGVLAVGGGAAGLVLTRHPVAPSYGAAPAVATPTAPAVAAATGSTLPGPAFPAPTAPIVAATQQQAGAVSQPASLTIPSIGVQTNIIHLGLTASGALQVPSSTAVAGWYTGSPRPGATGSSVIAGHIDSKSGPGVFFRLSSLHPGDLVYVRRADGTLATFRVTQLKQYAKDSFPASDVYGPVPDAELRLVTCGGTFDAQKGSYLSNTVVYAVATS
jgi:LPXTG-site transpeptidase (sortase) family protein